MYKKHYPPALSDEVWRLEKIGKDGPFHKRLSTAGIFTVEEFLRLVVRDQQKLRKVSLDFGSKIKMLLLCIFLLKCLSVFVDSWKWHVK